MTLCDYGWDASRDGIANIASVSSLIWFQSQWSPIENCNSHHDDGDHDDRDNDASDHHENRDYDAGDH